MRISGIVVYGCRGAMLGIHTFGDTSLMGFFGVDTLSVVPHLSTKWESFQLLADG